MKNQKPNEMSTEKLLEQQKTIKVVTGTLAGMLIILLILGIFLAVEQKLYAFIPIPIALLPIVFVNINNLKEIKKELNSRQSGMEK